jgi:hypothetical protein
MSIKFKIKKQLYEFVIKKQINENEVRLKYDINLPDDILKIKDIFVKNGYELFLVGGSVRDILLNKVPKDYDLATDATPDEVERILEKDNYKTIPTGKAFGVINVITDNDEYEIATFRFELYSEKDKRRPESVALKRMQKNTTLTDAQIIKFSKINNIDKKLVKAFIDFELTVNSEEVMDKFNLKSSKELGEKITALEIDNFNKMLK